MPSNLPAHSPLGGSGAARWMKCPGSVIDQFGVGHMREMDQAQRREFLDLLKGKVAE